MPRPTRWAAEAMASSADQNPASSASHARGNVRSVGVCVCVCVCVFFSGYRRFKGKQKKTHIHCNVLEHTCDKAKSAAKSIERCQTPAWLKFSWTGWLKHVLAQPPQEKVLSKLC